MEPKPDDKCKVCNHTFFYHAPDMSTDKNRCWHGCVTGNSCEKQCLDFVPMEGK